MGLVEKYKTTEVGIIPEDWECVQLGDIGECIIGLTYRPQDVKDEGRLVLRSSNIYENRLVFTDNVYVNVPIKDNLIIRENDILICVRNGSRNLIGKCALIDRKTAGQTFGAFMSVFRSELGQYLFYCFQSCTIKKQINEIMGATINQITNKDLKSFYIAMPLNLEEQENIVAVLSDIDALINSLILLINKKKNIKHGIMQELLTGRKRLDGFSSEWGFETLGQACEIYRGGSPRPIKTFLTNSMDGVNWIKIGDVEASARYINATKEKIIPEGARFSREVHKGDLILSNSMSFGRPYILNIDGCIHDGWLVIQNYHDKFVIHFLYYLLSSNETMAQYIALASGSGVQNLSKDKVAGISVPIISKDEQIAIASILADMDAEIEQLEVKLSKYNDIKQGMMQELLTGRIRLL